MKTKEPTLPYFLEAEYAVIGSLFIDASRVQDCVEFLKSKYFFVKRHQIIIDAVISLINESKPCDLISVMDKLRCLKQENIFETPDQIQMFLSYATHSENVKEYLISIKKYWELREVIKVCSDIIDKSKNVGNENIDNFLQDVEKVFLKLSESRVSEGLVPSEIVVKETLDNLEITMRNEGESTGISSGFIDFDKIINGFQPSDLIILAARPAMGKTALALNFAMHSAIIQKKQVALFSLEMSRVQLMQRFLSMSSRISASKFRNGKMSLEEIEILYPEAKQFQTDKLMIDDTPSLSLFDLNSRCRKMKREKGNCDLIIIDYLQLMTSGSGKNIESREREISMISMGLKALAKEMRCPVLACSQLNRGVESRLDKRPKTSDLRESGSIEQDADLVFFIYRDEVYEKDTLHKGIAEIIIGKNRHGPTDTVKLSFLNEYTSFHNLAN